MSVKLDTESIKFIGMFEGATGAKVKDCIIEDDHVIFVVNPGEMGLAIGRDGVNVKSIQQSIGKGIRLYEYSSEPSEFIRSLMEPIKVKEIEMKEIEIKGNGKKKQAVITLPQMEKGLAIGRKGKNIQRIKALLQRHHGIEDIRIK